MNGGTGYTSGSGTDDSIIISEENESLREQNLGILMFVKQTPDL